MSVSVATNAAAALRLYSEAWNQGHIQVIDELYSPEFADNDPVPGVPANREGTKMVFGLFRSAFPDIHFTPTFTVEQDDKVVIRWEATGTNSGSLMGMPPSGKQATIDGIDILRFADGNVVERWGNFDMLSLLQQIGAAPVPGQ